jgi:hypothetical protein
MNAADVDFARQMVERLQAVLLESAGLQTVTIAGQAVSFSQAQAQFEFWKKRLDTLQGTRPRLLTVELAGGT